MTEKQIASVQKMVDSGALQITMAVPVHDAPAFNAIEHVSHPNPLFEPPPNHSSPGLPRESPMPLRRSSNTTTPPAMAGENDIIPRRNVGTDNGRILRGGIQLGEGASTLEPNRVNLSGVSHVSIDTKSAVRSDFDVVSDTVNPDPQWCESFCFRDALGEHRNHQFWSMPMISEHINAQLNQEWAKANTPLVEWDGIPIPDWEPVSKPEIPITWKSPTPSICMQLWKRRRGTSIHNPAAVNSRTRGDDDT